MELCDGPVDLQNMMYGLLPCLITIRDHCLAIAIMESSDWGQQKVCAEHDFGKYDNYFFIYSTDIALL